MNYIFDSFCLDLHLLLIKYKLLLIYFYNYNVLLIYYVVSAALEAKAIKFGEAMAWPQGLHYCLAARSSAVLSVWEVATWTRGWPIDLKPFLIIDRKHGISATCDQTWLKRRCVDDKGLSSMCWMLCPVRRNGTQYGVKSDELALVSEEEEWGIIPY